MKCMVTGGAGFIGSHIVDRLIKDGHEVVMVDDLSTGKKENINEKASFSQMDISLPTAIPYLTILMKDVEVIFHLAAFPRVEPSIHEPVGAHNINVNGTHNMLVAARDAKVKRFVLTSSSAVYGEAGVPTDESHSTNPMSPYALHKLIGEQYCKLFSDLYGLETISLRYSNAYGEGQPTSGSYCNVMGIFEQQKSKGEDLTIVGDGEQRRDFVYVGDIVNANIKAGFLDIKFNGDIFNIGSGKNYSVNQIAEWIGGNTTNIPPRIEPKETLLDNNKANFILNWETTMELEEWIKNK